MSDWLLARTGWPVYLSGLALLYSVGLVIAGAMLTSNSTGMLPLPLGIFTVGALPAAALAAAWRRARLVQGIVTVVFIPVALILWPLVPALLLLLYGLFTIPDDDPR